MVSSHGGRQQISLKQHILSVYFEVYMLIIGNNVLISTLNSLYRSQDYNTTVVRRTGIKSIISVGVGVGGTPFGASVGVDVGAAVGVGGMLVLAPILLLSVDTENAIHPPSPDFPVTMIYSLVSLSELCLYAPADGKKILRSHTCTYEVHVCQFNPTLPLQQQLALRLPVIVSA